MRVESSISHSSYIFGDRKVVQINDFVIYYNILKFGRLKFGTLRLLIPLKFKIHGSYGGASNYVVLRKKITALKMRYTNFITYKF